MFYHNTNFKGGPVFRGRVRKPFRESSHSSKESEAKRLLKIREGKIAEGKFLGLQVDRVTFDELAQDLMTDYKINKKKSTDTLRYRIKNLSRFFAGYKAKNITTDKIREYILLKQKNDAANATINHELAALKRMFNLARQLTPPKVIFVPYIPHLDENNVRTGYFEHTDFVALKAVLPFYLHTPVTIAYHTGMRAEEILGLKWEQVDLLEGKITLFPLDTKNNQSRIAYMDGDFLQTILQQKSLRDRKFPDAAYVCFGLTGNKIKDFRDAWETACDESGIGKKYFHDFRRTGVRNMVRAGVPERVAMMISGHKTRSVFDRYNIVNEDDLRQASRKVSEYHLNKEKLQNGQSRGHSLGTVGKSENPESAYLH